MARSIPPLWDPMKAYSVGQLVYYYGSVYKCLVTVDVPPNNRERAVAEDASAIEANQILLANPIPPLLTEDNLPYSNPNDAYIDRTANPLVPKYVEEPVWQFEYVLRIEDYFSLQEAVKLALNTNDSMINDSIPMFIQQSEIALNDVVRSPAQRTALIFVTDQFNRIQIPPGMLEIINMRIYGDSGGKSYSFRDRGYISIERAFDRPQFEQMKQYYKGNNGFQSGIGQAEYPVYWDDGQYYWLALDYPEGTEVEIVFFQSPPTLGSQACLFDVQGRPLNNRGQYLTEWLFIGGVAENFLQTNTYTYGNLWTSTTPHLLKLGACVQAETYLYDEARATVWKTEYEKLLEKTVKKFGDYESLRQRSQVLTIDQFSDWVW